MRADYVIEGTRAVYVQFGLLWAAYMLYLGHADQEIVFRKLHDSISL